MSNPQILVVEDEGIVAADIQDRLAKLGYDVPAAVDCGDDALAKIPHVSPDLVLMDILLKGEKDGIDTAVEIRERFEIPVVFLTAHAEESTLKRAKAAEPYGYLLKPFEEKELQSAVEIALHKHRMERERAKSVTDQHQKFQKTLEATVNTLTKLLAVADPQSFQFSQKVQEYAKLCSSALNLEQAEEISTAALLCRVGILTVPAMLLQKVRAGLALAPAEKETMTRMPEAARNLLGAYPSFEAIANIIYFQSKNFNGTGFPAGGPAGLNIPFGGRLLRILTDLVHIETEEQSKHKTLEKMKASSGIYDPKLLQEVAVAVSSGPKKGRAVQLKDLSVGQVLVEPIETNDGVLVLNAGNKITPWMLKKLSNFVQLSGIREPVYVES